MLCGGGHFTSVMRTGSGWMHFDGFDSPRFKMYSEGKGRQAMRGRSIALMMYEITDKSINTLVGNPSAKLEELFDITPTADGDSDSDSSGVELVKRTPARESPKKTAPIKSEKKKTVKSQRDINEALMGMSKMMTRAAKKIKPSSAKKKTQWGFHRRTPQKRGQRPRCKGCNKIIDYAEGCIKHVWKNPNLKHPSDWTYHIATKCLSKMKDVHKIQFANMDWKGDKVR